MELIFNKEEVEALLLKKVESMGIKANKVVFTAPYADLQSARVSFEEKKPTTEEDLGFLEPISVELR